MLRMTGASRWSGWRSKTSSCPFNSREPWPLRRRPAARPEPRWGNCAYLTLCLKGEQFWTQGGAVSKTDFRPLCFFTLWPPPPLFPPTGDSSRGRDERVTGAEGGLPGDRWISVGSAAALPSDPQHHRRWEELDHHLPTAAGDDARLHETLNRCFATHPLPVHAHTRARAHTHSH